MTGKAAELRELYLNLAEDETITESQEQVPNHDPVDATEAAIESEVIDYRREDGLDDALEGIESSTGAAA